MRRLRVLRLAGLGGITVTGLVHFVLLRPLLDLDGADGAADKLLHMVVPVLAIAGWLPRRRQTDRMDLTDATTWAAERKHAVIITIRKDGRPQSSDIVYALDGDTFLVSVTDDRAKTNNMRRDPRILLHVTEPSSWSYLSLDGTVELSVTTTEPGDATSDALCAYYEKVAGAPHDDWDEYRAAMVAEKRLIARFTPTSAVGQVH